MKHLHKQGIQLKCGILDMLSSLQKNNQKRDRKPGIDPSRGRSSKAGRGILRITQQVACVSQT